jgi:hypothetical protein
LFEVPVVNPNTILQISGIITILKLYTWY